VAPVVDTVSVFGTEKDGTISIELAQQATAELKSAVEGLVQRHSDVQQLKQLRKAISDLPDGRYFLVLPAAPSSTADKLQLESYLAQLNDPDAVPEASVDDLFGPLLGYYDMSMPRTDRNTVIGAGNKICRFCQRTAEQGATFKKAAHVIPMALGNSFLKSDQECDDCNAYFGSHTEPALIAMLDVERVFLGIQGRAKNDGRPMLAFGNDKISHDGEKMVIHAHSVSQDSAGTFEINLGKGRLFVPLAVYRALVKIAVSVVGEGHLKHLKRTIDWVRHGLPADQALPLVATTLVDLPPNPSGQITVYERKQPHSKLPHLVGEFRLGCYLFVFAVPFSDADDWNLVGFFDDADFRAHFKHYAAVPKWQHRNLSSTAQISLAPQLRLSPRVGGRPKTQSE
jgi:hypothetical protein